MVIGQNAVPGWMEGMLKNQALSSEYGCRHTK
eukprot:SAG11_NODE_16007_length_559_cov_1.536957_1_plen_31_part_10